MREFQSFSRARARISPVLVPRVLILDGNARSKCAYKARSMLLYLSKAFDQIESGQKSDFFFSEKTYFPICVRNMS